MPIIDCNACGHALRVAEELKENSEFSCAHCGQILRNNKYARQFRWKAQDLYLRRNGASRTNLWGGFLGSTAWLPLMIVVQLATGTFDPVFDLALAVPYVAMLWILIRRRGRRPALLWGAWLWIGLGLYLLYVWGLFQVFPQSAGNLLDMSGSYVDEGKIAVFGFVGGLVGAAILYFYRRRSARIPSFDGVAPGD